MIRFDFVFRAPIPKCFFGSHSTCPSFQTSHAESEARGDAVKAFPALTGRDDSHQEAAASLLHVSGSLCRQSQQAASSYWPLPPSLLPNRERWEEDTNFLPSLITGHDFTQSTKLPYAIAQLQLRKPVSILKPVLQTFLTGRKSIVEKQRILKAMALQTAHGVNWKSTFREKSKKPKPQPGMLK